jgi:hypothetical protein
MNMTRDRLQSIGWVAVLLVCFAMLIALTFRVNAVKSQVRLAERQIGALNQENKFLETEFETRANQQQLRALNDVEFGYQAPTSAQYLEGERQLAALGQPAGPGSPSPIRVAAADNAIEQAGAEKSGLVAMVAPLAGSPLATKVVAAKVAKADGRHPLTAATLGDRLNDLSGGTVRSE